MGKTQNVAVRYQQHIEGRGAAWTAKYKPVKLIRTIENASPFDEDKITKEYMCKYGIDKVRGGSYVEVKLSDFHTDALKMEIWAAQDLCTTCGRKGHFAKNCYATTDILGEQIEYDEDESENEEWECEYCDGLFVSEYACEKHEQTCARKKQSNHDTCYRCGYNGHYASSCYAARHVKGYTLY